MSTLSLFFHSLNGSDRSICLMGIVRFVSQYMSGVSQILYSVKAPMHSGP